MNVIGNLLTIVVEHIIIKISLQTTKPTLLKTEKQVCFFVKKFKVWDNHYNCNLTVHILQVCMHNSANSLCDKNPSSPFRLATSRRRLGSVADNSAAEFSLWYWTSFDHHHACSSHRHQVQQVVHQQRIRWFREWKNVRNDWSSHGKSQRQGKLIP